MRLVTIRSELLSAYAMDPEVLQKTGRPYVAVMNLRYKGKRHLFAVPLRSNIAGNAPKNQYFPLPTRSATRDGRRHGIHYIKMFPVRKSDLIRYRVDGNESAILVQDVIERNSSDIILQCQNYLTAYETGNHPLFSTDIDLLLHILGNIAEI
ncbi:MAG: hypothetical protein Q4C60_09515 [Eubacteriales bacterium]|nr:hypothetical protein [Eubacteriales bacterium]